MSALLSPDAPDTSGIDDRFLANVPDEAQARLARAYADKRVVWNNAIEQFQVVAKEPGERTRFLGTYLDGWIIIGTWDPPLDVDNIISTLRSREQFTAWKLRKMGYGTEADSDADVIEAYLDDADRIVEEASERLWQEAVDDYLDGPVARARDENAIFDRTMKRIAAESTTRRAHAKYKLVLPVSGNTSRIVRGGK